MTTPWGLLFLPDGDALVSERDTANILRVTQKGKVSVVGKVPGVEPRGDSGEGGLLGIAVAKGELYAYFSSGDDNRIIAMSYDVEDRGSQLGEPRLVFSGLPKSPFHNGGRIVFGPDGYLYVAAGDGTHPPNSQDMNSTGGKILRITTDGKPAPGNPFPDSPIWSLGHRNPQGLVFDPDGRLWASEFGQDTWDELNLIEPGKNYGWPDVEGKGESEKYTNPMRSWPTDDASPSGLTYAKGSLWMAALKGTRLWQIPIADGALAGEPRAHFVGKYGRLRTIEPAPDGSLWLTTSNTDGRGESFRQPDDDKILRLTLR